MKAITYTKYGPPDVLQFTEVPKPIPKDNEVLIKIHATTVTAADWRVRSLDVPVGFGLISRLVLGISKPKQPILGSELAGEIESAGKDVSKFKVGDPVFAFSGLGMGCHAEYKCMPEDGAVVLKPANLTYDEAAALSFGGTTALDFFRRGKLQRGEKVLVNGASGAVGTAAVQLAKHFGADVTGVCSSANLELVQSLGARHVIDYTQEDFTRNGETYDVVVDTAGTAPFTRSKGSLKERGRLLQVLGSLPDLLRVPWVSLTSSKKVIAGPAAERAEDLRFLARLAEAGEFKPVIDRRYPFEQIVEAHRYVDTGRKKGNVVITLETSHLAKSMLEDDHYIATSRNANIDTSEFKRRLLDRLTTLQDADEEKVYESAYDLARSFINVTPPEPDEESLVCRYLTPEKFLRFLDSRRVTFPTATQFKDRWECSIPENYNDAILHIFQKIDRSAAGWTEYVKTKAAGWNVSCWTELVNYFDDHLMWDAYADGSQGVGVTVRYGLLKAHLARAAKLLDVDGQLQSGLVNYENLSLLPFNKHYIFRYEKEVRFAFRGCRPGATSISIDEIFNLFGVRISPAATVEHRDMVRKLWLRYGGEDRIQWPQ